MAKQTALVTGASGGIGYELAKQFARHGHDLFLVARNGDKLKEISDSFQHLYHRTVHILPLNLSRPDAPDELYHYLRRHNITIDYLVNNAGFAMHGPFREADLSETLELLQLNITTVTQLTRLFLADMATRNTGGILNIASTAAFQPGPMMSAYYASKAYVLSFTEAIAIEMKKTNVKISVLCPGPTDTDFQRRAGNTRTLLGAKGMMMMEAEKVARIGYRQFMNNKRVIVPGFLNKAGAFASARAPRALVLPVISTLQKKR